MVPVAALAGFMVGGRAVAQMVTDPKAFAEVKRLSHWPNPTDADTLAIYRLMVRVAFGTMLATAFAIFFWPAVRTRFWPEFFVTYIDGPTVKCARGPTLLEISRANGVPHASICGGRARCSTCRVRVDAGRETLPDPTFPEVVTLGSIGAPENIRLACQIRPVADIAVTRLLRAQTITPADADAADFGGGGVEKSLAVMVLDLRDFTRLAQSKLPHDVVFLLNELFAAAGSAIAQYEGWIDKFMGDGLLAVFGDQSGIENGCRQALRAARAIDLALDHINEKLETELGRPLRIGIGIEAGPLLMGRIGFGTNVDVTVIGNPVNVASRLEGLAKERGVQIVVSRAAAVMAGWDPPPEIVSKAEVSGLKEPIEIVSVLRGRDLPTSILSAADAAAAVIT
jgi:adenylate cyclase